MYFNENEFEIDINIEELMKLTGMSKDEIFREIENGNSLFSSSSIRFRQQKMQVDDDALISLNDVIDILEVDSQELESIIETYKYTLNEIEVYEERGTYYINMSALKRLNSHFSL